MVHALQNKIIFPTPIGIEKKRRHSQTQDCIEPPILSVSFYFSINSCVHAALIFHFRRLLELRLEGFLLPPPPNDSSELSTLLLRSGLSDGLESDEGEGLRELM